MNVLALDYFEYIAVLVNFALFDGRGRLDYPVQTEAVTLPPPFCVPDSEEHSPFC